MLALKYLLMILGVGLFGSAGALVAYDILLATQLRRLLGGHAGGEGAAEVGRWPAALFGRCERGWHYGLRPVGYWRF